MSDEEINIAIAEACGWEISPDKSQFRKPNQLGWQGRGFQSIYECLPNYCNDLNAMQSAVLSQSKEFQDRFDQELKNSGEWIASMKSKDWAIIFVKLLGKWQEKVGAK